MPMGRRWSTVQGESWIPTDTLRRAPGHRPIEDAMKLFEKLLDQVEQLLEQVQ